MDRFPRTVGEFIESGRMVIQECEACRRKAPMDLSMLELTFGSASDVYASMREMRDRLNCPACGHARPVISFHNPNAPHFQEVSFEDSVTSSLEFSASSAAGVERVARQGGRPSSQPMSASARGTPRDQKIAAANNRAPATTARTMRDRRLAFMPLT